MILAVMSLQQWMDIHTVNYGGVRRLSYNSLRASLGHLQMTDIRLLLIVCDWKLVEKYDHFLNIIPSDFGVADELLLIRSVSEESKEAYTEALRRVFRMDIKSHSATQIKMLESTETIVSFTPHLQKIDEFSNLSFYNPGTKFQHYRAWVASHVPIFPSQHTIVMSLGNVIKQDKQKIISLLTPIVLRRLPDADLAKIIAKLSQLIAEQEVGPDGYIYQLQMSFLEESLFDEKMITRIQERIGLHLSSEEFNQIWQITNPSFERFKPLLERVNARAMRRAQYGLECISLTNIKDIRHLIKELRAHDCAFEIKNDQLVGFAGIPLTCSFVDQKTTVDMLRDIVKKVSIVPSFLSAHTSGQAPVHPVYFVSSETNMSENLTAISQISGVTLLLGWDGSPLQEWVNEKLAIEKEAEFTATPYTSLMG